MATPCPYSRGLALPNPTSKNFRENEAPLQQLSPRHLQSDGDFFYTTRSRTGGMARHGLVKIDDVHSEPSRPSPQFPMIYGRLLLGEKGVRQQEVHLLPKVELLHLISG